MHYIQVRELPSGDGVALLLKSISQQEVEKNLFPLMPTLISDGIVKLYHEQKQAVDSNWGLVTKIVGDDKQASLAEFCAVAGGSVDQYEHLYSNESSISTMRVGDAEAHQMSITPGRSLNDRIYGDVGASPTLVLTADDGTVHGFLVAIENKVHLLEGEWDEDASALAVTSITSSPVTIARVLFVRNVYPDATPSVVLTLGKGKASWWTQNLIPNADDPADSANNDIEPFTLVHPQVFENPVAVASITDAFCDELLGYGSGGLYEPDVGDPLPITSGVEIDAVSVSYLPSVLSSLAFDHLDRQDPPGELAHKNADPPLNKGAFSGDRVYIAISTKDNPLLRQEVRQTVQREGGRIVFALDNAGVAIVAEHPGSLDGFRGRRVEAAEIIG